MNRQIACFLLLLLVGGLLGACSEPKAVDYRAMAFSAIAAAQAERGDVAAARESAALARDAAASADGGWSGEAKAAAAAALARTGDVDAALEMVWKVDANGDSNGIALVMVGTALVRAGAAPEALDLANGAADADDRREALSFVAAALADKGEMKAARHAASLVVEAAKMDKNDGSLFFAAWAQAKAGDVAGAVTTANMIEDEKHRALASFWIATAQIEAGDFSPAIELADQMSGHDIKGEDILLRMFYRGVAADFDDVVNAWWQVVESVDLGVLLLSEVAIAQAKAGRSDEAKRTARHALELAQAMQGRDRDGSLLVAIVAQAYVGDTAAAHSSAKLIEDSSLGVAALDLSARMLALRGDAIEAQHFGDLAVSAASRIEPQDQRKWSRPRGLAFAHAVAGRIPMAIEMIRKLGAEEREFTLFQVALALVETGDISGALVVAKGLSGDDEHRSLARRVALLLAKAGQLSSARRLIASEFEQALRIEDKSDRTDVLRALADLQAQFGTVGAARETLAAAATAPSKGLFGGYHTAPLFDILRAQIALGAAEDARRTAGLISDVWRDMTDHCYDLDSVIDLARFAADLEDRIMAGDMLADLSDRAAGIPLASCRAPALAAVAEAQSSLGEGDLARRTLAAVIPAASAERDIQCCPDILVDLSKAQSAIGDATAARATIDRGLAVADSIVDQVDRIRLLLRIAEAQSAMGEVPAAQRTFLHALTAADGLTDPGERVTALADIAESQAETGDAPGARGTAERLVTAASTIPSPGHRRLSLERAALLQVRLGDAAVARATIASLRREDVDDDFLRSLLTDILEIAEQQSERGASAQAEESFALAGELGQSIADPKLRTEAMVDMAKVRADAGDKVAARRDLQHARELAQSIVDSRLRTEAMVDVAKALVGLEDNEAALEIVRRLDLKPTRDSVLSEMAEAAAQAGSVGDALDAALTIASEETRAAALAEIARRQIEASDLAGAGSTAALAASAATSIVNNYARARRLAGIAALRAESGDIAGAAEALARARASAGGLRDPSLRARVLTELAVAQSRMDDPMATSVSFALARAAARSEASSYYRAIGLVELAEAQSTAGDRAGANATTALAAEALQQLRSPE